MRRVLALVRNLPPESALHRAENGGAQWTIDTEIAAVTAELLWANVMSKVPRNKQPRKPFHIPRPHEKRRKKRPASPDEIRAFFAKRK
jgi:hypothetical protein